LGLNAPGHLSNKPHYSTSEERERESVETIESHLNE